MSKKKQHYLNLDMRLLKQGVYRSLSTGKLCLLEGDKLWYSKKGYFFVSMISSVVFILENYFKYEGEL